MGKQLLPPRRCIRVTYFGGTSDLTFNEWNEQFIQDDEHALEVSSDILETGEYPWNLEQPPEYYAEFSIADRDELIKQRKKFVSK